MNKIVHLCVSAIVFGLAMFINSHSPLLGVTLGTILNGAYLWLSHWINPTEPVNVGGLRG